MTVCSAGTVLWVAGLAFAGLACRSEPSDSHCDGVGCGAPPTLTLAEVTIAPSRARVDSTIAVSVRIRGVTAAELQVDVSGRPSQPLVLTAEAGGLRGVATVTAGPDVGRDVVRVHGTSNRGPVIGFAVVAVGTAATSCGPNEVWEAGHCVSESDTHALEVTAEIWPGKGFETTERKMIHPRVARRVGGALVACLTDAVAVIRADAVEAATPASGSLVSQTMLTTAGLLYCEHLIVDEQRGLAIATSRGTRGAGGGVSTWKLPPLTAPPYGPPVFVHAITTPDGFESVAQHGDRLYVGVKKPGGVEVLCLADDGKMTRCGTVANAGMRSTWALVVDGDRLLATDADGPEHEDRGALPGHSHGGGHLYLLSLADPSAPALLGLVHTASTGKALAVLPDGVVAVATGGPGVQLVDVSNPVAPVTLTTVDTPGSATSVAYDDGYLLVGDWNALRVYDASERGGLRLLDAMDLSPRVRDGTPLGKRVCAFDSEEAIQIGEGGFLAPTSQLQGVAFVAMQGLDFVSTDMDCIELGRIRPGSMAPHAVFQDGQVWVSDAELAAPRPFAVVVENAGRRPLVIRAVADEHVSAEDAAVVVGPGELSGFEFTLLSLPADAPMHDVRIETNEADGVEGRFRLTRVEGVYRVGEPAPQFRLPSLDCAGGGCGTGPGCVGLDDPALAGKVVVLAFFSSW